MCYDANTSDILCAFLHGVKNRIATNFGVLSDTSSSKSYSYRKQAHQDSLSFGFCPSTMSLKNGIFCKTDFHSNHQPKATSPVTSRIAKIHRIMTSITLS
uniref:Uncharacterized protein n=1 Tax=Hanusia phi TaxID=3032 RepID=A0A7S0NEJ8_9CRYP|mmetsp:Transcript_8485/g.19212  ORF Transcript_8485/g.19212 Transcript_8485/m.19212 type:complete len:100 (+) Transcript_8485:176-475(+)